LKEDTPEKEIFMVIFIEKKILPESTVVFEKIARTLGMISLKLSQLERTLTILEFSESYFGEGSLKDRKYVEERIVEIQRLVAELGEVDLLFTTEDIQTSFEKKQSALRKVGINILSIRQNMLSIWSMGNSGTTTEDNSKIQELILKMFKNVNNSIRKISVYVADFNTVSARKLSFRVKWTKLPK
jgi:hypothetical protein